MFNEEAKAGMEIKQSVDEGQMSVNEGFENPYVSNTDSQDTPIMEQPIEAMEQPTMPAVILYRSKDGIQRWMNEEEIGQTLAQSKGKVCDEKFLQDNAKEIKEYIEKQPEGMEIGSVFDILEPGDFVNHQTIVSVEDKSVTLDYFGKKSVLANEQEIFSILIKDEIDEWKRLIKETDINLLFADSTSDMLSLFRTMELTCMNINMEDCDGLYCVDQDVVSQRLVGMMSASLRKPIYDTPEQLQDKKIISFSIDYPGEIEVPEKATHLYHLSLMNSSNKEMFKNDRVVLC